MRYHFLALFLGIVSNLAAQELVTIPAGNFIMGDHQGLGGTEHRNDELPLHQVSLDTFSIARYETTNAQFAVFLNETLAEKRIEVRNGFVFLTGGRDTLFETYPAKEYSRISWDGVQFEVRNARGGHPVTGVRWHGAAAYCNWLSRRQGFLPSYNETSWVCDFTGRGYRLPTEAEWEFAGRGGKTDPYLIMPWGDDYYPLKGNFEASGDPFENGDYPWTTPVGFYDGSLRKKQDYAWPDARETWQTHDGRNGYGLADMAGNVWEWVNDWYGREYYAVSPSLNPKGPAENEASPMPDNKPYRVLRGGNWYNGKDFYGHARVSNRNPGYYRGPQDPNHPYYHIGFRIARSGSTPTSSETTDFNASGTISELEIWPVPSAGAVHIAWNQYEQGTVTLQVVSMSGLVMKVMDETLLMPGKHQITIADVNGFPGLPQGIYVAVIQSGTQTHFKRFALIYSQ
jgi:formylglycine-generating enzyme required for sulfatase activity